MIPTALSLLTALFGAVGKIFEWLYAKRLTDAGKVQAQLEALQRQVEVARVAVAAREQQRSIDALGVDVERLPDDPFRRD
jgi:hypothetical protein